LLIDIIFSLVSDAIERARKIDFDSEVFILLIGEWFGIWEQELQSDWDALNVDLSQIFGLGTKVWRIGIGNGTL
jgi:hypothetical protein